MAKVLQISRPTICSDIRVLRRQAKTNVKTYVEGSLPFEHESLMTGIKSVLKKAWSIVNNPNSSEKAVVNALHVILQVYTFKRQLLVDSTALMSPVVDDFIEEQNRELYLQTPQAIVSGRDENPEAIFAPDPHMYERKSYENNDWLSFKWSCGRTTFSILLISQSIWIFYRHMIQSFNIPNF
jgi:hypothetical protein